MSLGDDWDATGTRSGSDSDDSQRSQSGTRRRLAGMFSPRAFLVALVLSLVGLFVGGAIPIVGIVGRFVGLFAAAFLVGLISSRRRYVEVATAGALASGTTFLMSALGTVLFPVVAEYGLEIAGVGVGAGALVALAGHYFGRDLRAGLTKDLG